MSTTVLGVADRHACYNRMNVYWGVDRALWGGTRTMREAGKVYLPQSPMEDNPTWIERRDRSFLFNAYRRTIEKMVGKVFSKAVKGAESYPGDVSKWAENIDRNGRNLDTFAREVFRDGMRKGISYILADSPPIPAGTTLEDQRKNELRPYLIHIKAENLIGYKMDKLNGVNVLTQIRYREWITRDATDGFNQIEVERIRVIEPNAYYVYESTGGDKPSWMLVESGPMALGRIALSVFYTNQEAFMESIPPLDDLAHLNVSHWQSSSDQRQILHFARVPMLFGKGLATREGSDDITVSASTIIKGPVDSDLKFVEHSGAAIDAGRQEILDIETRMEIYGLELLIKKPGGAESATGRVLDSGEQNSPLQEMALMLQDCLENAFKDLCAFQDLKIPTDSALIVNTDFGLAFAANAMLQELIKARASGEISRETFWERCVYFGLLQEDFDPEEEQRRLDAEPPGDMGSFPASPNRPPKGNGQTPPGKTDLQTPPNDKAKEAGATQ